jgi:putative transposase
MRGQARDWGTAKTFTILFKQGKWYASITVDCETARSCWFPTKSDCRGRVPTRLVTDTGAVGLDFGTHHAVELNVKKI